MESKTLQNREKEEPSSFMLTNPKFGKFSFDKPFHEETVKKFRLFDEDADTMISHLGFKLQKDELEEANFEASLTSFAE